MDEDYAEWCKDQTEADSLIIVDVVITPYVAMAMMRNLNPILYDGQNADQRKISAFASLMQSGQWGNAPEDSPISIGENGQLMNGLHRLSAIVESGITITDKVAFYVPDRMIKTEPDDMKERSDFAMQCAEFVLVLCGAKTMNNRTIAKVHDFIIADLSALVEIKKVFTPMDCAAAVAIVYAAKLGEGIDYLSDRVKSFSKTAGTRVDLFESMTRHILSVDDDAILFYDASIMVPDDVYQAVSK